MLSILLATAINGHATVQLRAPESFHAGANEVAIEFQIKPGWHIYWQNPGDSGEEPRAAWKVSPAEAATFGALEYPIPARLTAGPFTNFGFASKKDGIFFRVPVDVKSSEDHVDLEMNLTYLVCREACVPEHADLKISVPIRGAGSAALPFRDSDFPKRVGLGSRREPYRSVYKVESETVALMRPSSLVLPAEFEFFPVTKQALTAGDAGRVVAPDQFDVAIDGSVLAKDVPEKILGLLVDKKNAKAVWVEFSRENRFDLAAFLTAIGFAFLGGLLLNLMPCVFPVVSLKVLSFVREGSGDPREIRRHAYAYAAGILLSFWVLVGVLLLLRAAGASVGWGFQLQNPIFLFVLLAVFFVLGLNLLGVFEFNYQGPAGLQNLMMKRGLCGSFFTGLLTTVVATPCSAPFMGVAVGTALAGSVAEGFAVFTFLALGLASPYLVLAMKPAWVSRLPRPGPWMETLKEFLAFPLLLTAVWLFWVMSQSVDVGGLVLVLVWCVAAGFMAWSLRRRILALRLLATVFLLGSTVTSVVTLHTDSMSGGGADSLGAVHSENAWQPYSDARLRSELAGGKSVFVDFTASWCVTCQVNKRLVLLTVGGDTAFAAQNVVRLRADWTKRDSEITNALTRLGRNSVPVYAFYRNGSEQAELLPEILTLDILKKALEKK